MVRIREVELIPDFRQSRASRHRSVVSTTNAIRQDIHSGRAKKVCKLKGYTIYQKRTDGYEENCRFYALNDTTEMVDMTVGGWLSRIGNMERFKIGVLEGRPGSRIRAYQFYRAILLNMPMIFTTDTQSYGGLRTWQELSNYSDIEVFGWDRGPVNVDPKDPDDTHAIEDDLWRDPHDKDLKRIYNTKLVAHRKIEKRGTSNRSSSR